jgi:hypothetical protein
VTKTPTGGSPPKVLIYDQDRGLKSLATDERIKETFGYAPRRFIRTSSFIELFKKLHTATENKTEDILGEIIVEEFSINGDIQIEVLDSITAWASQKKKEAKGSADRISLPMWGEIGESLEDLVVNLARTDTHVIILGHVKTEKDDDLGTLRYIPALSGRMQHEIGRHFDMVLYTIVEKDPRTNARRYMWQVLADERRNAKCRVEEVSKFSAEDKRGGKIPQDFALLFNLCKEHKALKILILGETGTGKTYSLRTLKGVRL